MTTNELAKAKIKQKIAVWHQVQLETYVLIYDLAKERFDDLISEVESVTDKSIKMATGILLFTDFFAGYLISKPALINHFTSLLVYSGIVIFAELVLLTYLVFPKKVKNKGLSPRCRPSCY